jgi:hypothetical protein
MLYTDGAFKLANPLASPLTDSYTVLEKRGASREPRQFSRIGVGECQMLIVNDDHLRLAGVASLEERCPYCSKTLATYPLVMSDDPSQTVYHVTCALELATDLLVDLATFFHPPAPYRQLYTLLPLETEQGRRARRRKS